MKQKEIVTNKKIEPVKLALAKAFRRQMTEGEGILWEQLRANKLESIHFRRQQIIRGYIADFYCHAAGLVIEVDGDIHELQKDYDYERDLVFMDAGLQVMRFTNEDIKHNLQYVLVQILNTCREMI